MNSISITDVFVLFASIIFFEIDFIKYRYFQVNTSNILSIRYWKRDNASTKMQTVQTGSYFLSPLQFSKRMSAILINDWCVAVLSHIAKWCTALWVDLFHSLYFFLQTIFYAIDAWFVNTLGLWHHKQNPTLDWECEEQASNLSVVLVWQILCVCAEHFKLTILVAIVQRHCNQTIALVSGCN